MALANKDISYLSKDFNDIRAQLINYSQTYFPNSYTDFSPASPGMMFIEQAAPDRDWETSLRIIY